jgi:hypothetical protein
MSSAVEPRLLLLGLLIPSMVGRTEWPETAELGPAQGGVAFALLCQYGTVQYHHGCSAAQGRPGTDAMVALGSAALGWTFPTLPACQSTRQANSLQTHARRLPSFHLSCCLLRTHSPQRRRFDLALFFLFFSYPSTARTARAPSAFFFSLRPYCCDFKRSILSRAFCRRCLPPFVVGASRSRLRQSTATTSRLDLPDSRASTTPPHKNTGCACYLVSLRVSWIPAEAGLPL